MKLHLRVIYLVGQKTYALLGTESGFLRTTLAGIHTLYYALAVAVLLPDLDVPSRYLLPIRLT